MKWSRSGASASLRIVSQDWKSTLVRAAPGLFPPDLVVQVKALASELPAKYERPLSRWSNTDLVQHVQQSGLVASVSGSTLRRWLQKMPFGPGITAVGSFHAIRTSLARRALRSRYPRLTLVHAPIHASRLNQVEIHFSIVQRKVLTPNDFHDLNAVAERLLGSQYYWETTGQPFEWKFTRQDLAELLAKLGRPH